MRLKGITALITGGTRGIGAAVLRPFMAERARVVFSGRTLNRFGEPHEVTGAAVFPASDEASFIAGQTPSINGVADMA